MFLKIILLCLVFLPAFLKAKEQETIKKRSVYKKNLLAPRSIKKGGKSFGELTLELAKQHMLQQIQLKRSTLKDFSNEVNEHSPDKCTKIKKVGDPIVHHHSGQAQGTWMRDPLGILGPEKIWYMNGFNGNKLLEFETMNKFKGGMISKTYDLPFKFDGTGAVVYGHYLYYNKAGTNVIVQYNLATESVTKEVVPHGSVKARQYSYQWGGYTTIDLSIDESGLWVMYAYPGSRGKLCVSLLDPLTMRVLYSYTSISSETMRSMGNAFVACGIVYMIDSYNTKTTTINYAYDTTTGHHWNPNIKFTNQFTYNSMVTYNPREKVLYGWDRSRQITYPLEFEKPI